nr:uncharacterized protein LOC129438958 [Misgurnus anguillicaudatus]
MDTQDSEEDVGKMECEQPEKTTSPAPSYTSLQSDHSMDPPVQFKDNTTTIRLRPDKTSSPAPSYTSLQSDHSMDPPVQFKDNTRTISLRPNKTTSPAPSSTSLKSDHSMDRPIQFTDRTQKIRLTPVEATSPAPSCTSLRSDHSMDRPIQFKDETQSFIKDESILKQNVMEPFDKNLRKEVLSPDISTFSATLLTEDHYRCSVCTEVFKNPVSIPCGHSYCKHCIEIYWSKPTQAECYACPQCRKRFRDRPVLYVNVALAKLIDELQRAGFSPALPAHCYAGPEDVSCDICTEMKLKAVKSCLTCCVSYCETHVRQHYTVPALQRHNLTEVTISTQDSTDMKELKDLQGFKTELLGKMNRVIKEQQEEIRDLRTKLYEQSVDVEAEYSYLAKYFHSGLSSTDLPKDLTEVVALGRHLDLGMLYDCRNESFSSGILSSVILYAKKILQDLCRKKLGWDDIIPVLSAQEWSSWLNGLHDLENFKIDRCFKPVGFGELTSARCLCNGKIESSPSEVSIYPSYGTNNSNIGKSNGFIAENRTVHASSRLCLLD